MQLVLHPEAQAEILEAADWYDQQDLGLGDDFLAEIAKATNVIVSRPDVWPEWPGTRNRQPSIQRYRLKRFRSFALAYQRFDGCVLVLAVVHGKRRPFYWLRRT